MPGEFEYKGGEDFRIKEKSAEIKQPELTHEQFEALRNYQSVPYVNTYLRQKAEGNPREDIQAQAEKEIAAIDSIFEDIPPLDKVTIVYRRLPSNQPSPDTASRPWYTATTLNGEELMARAKRHASEGSSRVVQKITLQPGQKAIYLPDFLEDKLTEGEMLLPRNTTFKITSRQEEDGVLVEIVEIA